MRSREEILRGYIEERKNSAVNLLPILHKAKELYGDIDTSVRKQIADNLAIPVADISAAVTFYSAFNGMDDGRADDGFLMPTAGNGQVDFITGHPKGFEAVKKTLREKTDILKILQEGKILGRSGSGFPVSKKWELTRVTPGKEKYIICNASEGEGNTYKDYYLLCNYPKTIIEGMILCSLATEITKGYIYVRLEYQKAYERVKEAVEEARAENALGDNIFGSGKSFEIEVILGGGAYVSGEETGLLQALEGNRSEPRIKPPFPGICGLYGKPTIINNAESFAAVAVLLYQGAEAFCTAGTENAGGSKLYTVCGCVMKSGIYEAPHSVTLRQILSMAGGPEPGKTVRGFQIGGGATGSFGDAAMLDTVLDYNALRKEGLALGTASIYFFSDEESVPDLVRKSIAFLKDQSCGMCTACKYGLADLLDKLDTLCSGYGTEALLTEIEELCGYIADTSRCALGQASPTALKTALKLFMPDFRRLCRKEEHYEYDLLND